jgi:hypothetical protein
LPEYQQCHCHADIISKRSKRSANFSLGSLREEVNEEINQEAINAKLLTDISSIDLNLVDSISVDVLICAVLVKYGLNIVCAVAHIVSSLCVLPVNVRANVLKLLHPELTVDNAETLFKCIRKLKLSSKLSNLAASDNDQVHVFAPPVGRCIDCNSYLVRHNDPVRVNYHHYYGSSKGMKVSLKCSRCKTFYGYSKSAWKSRFRLEIVPRGKTSSGSDRCLLCGEVPFKVANFFSVSYHFYNNFHCQ